MLTVPLVFAALSAGAVGGLHCVGMCGGISMLLAQAGQKRVHLHEGQGKVIPIAVASHMSNAQGSVRGLHARAMYQSMLHGGRIVTYMIAGAAFGGLGAAGMVLKPYMPVQQALFILGNLMLILLGLRLLGLVPNMPFKQGIWPGRFGISKRLPSLQQAARFPFFLGMAWGCLPCGLLYGVAPFALFSGSAWSGAILMLVFALSALPHLLLTQAIMQQARNTRLMRGLRFTCAGTLVAVGILGLVYFDMKNMPSVLCLLAPA